MKHRLLFIGLVLSCCIATMVGQEHTRIRDLGITTGVLQPGVFNAITDVKGISVGHVTLNEGDHIRTGVTAILPHDGNGESTGCSIRW
jgi:D-aminopeptidase